MSLVRSLLLLHFKHAMLQLILNHGNSSHVDDQRLFQCSVQLSICFLVLVQAFMNILEGKVEHLA